MGSMAREREKIAQRFGISKSASNEPHSPGKKCGGKQPRGMDARFPAEVVTRFLRNEPTERAKVIFTKGYGRELRAIQSRLSSRLEARDRREQPPSAGAPSPSTTNFLRNEPTAKPHAESSEPEQGRRAKRRSRGRFDPTLRSNRKLSSIDVERAPSANGG
jgi:hypothetical protein